MQSCMPSLHAFVLPASGTHVMEGTGKIMVVAVGVSCQTEVIFSLLGITAIKTDEKKGANPKDISSVETKITSADENSQSVLQKKLTLLATQIGKVGKKQTQL